MTDLTEDLDSEPRLQDVWFTTLCNSASRESKALFSPPRQLHSTYHPCPLTHIHTIKKNLKKNKPNVFAWTVTLVYSWNKYVQYFDNDLSFFLSYEAKIFNSFY